jgi:hypothetical protein
MIALPIKILILTWFFGWGFLLLKFPIGCCRLLSLGREPTPGQLRIAKIVGYLGVAFGCLFLAAVAFGIVH